LSPPETAAGSSKSPTFELQAEIAKPPWQSGSPI
jgi:hypothetical protein